MISECQNPPVGPTISCLPSFPGIIEPSKEKFPTRGSSNVLGGKV